MFVCANCGMHTEDADLRFAVRQPVRNSHPSPAMFDMRLCSDACGIEYVGRRPHYKFILTRHKGGPVKTLPVQDGETLADLIRARQI